MEDYIYGGLIYAMDYIKSDVFPGSEMDCDFALCNQ